MSIKYSLKDISDLADKLQSKLNMLYLNTGINAILFISTPKNGMDDRIAEFDDYVANYDGYVWMLVLELEIIRYPDGRIYKSYERRMRSNEIEILGQLNMKNTQDHIMKPPQYTWKGVTRSGGIVIFLIYEDGEVQRTPCEFSDNSDQLEVIEKLVKNHFEHPFVRNSQRMDIIKMELVQRINRP
jgi:hypothetical protein